MDSQTYRLWLIGIGAVLAVGIAAMVLFSVFHGSAGLSPGAVQRSVM